jgi:adenylylsulfate kinase-like enzyme
MITWFIGMSGSGKSTLARTLYDQLKSDTPHLVYLDGDEFREIFRNDVDHTIEGRRKNAERISHFCRILDQQDIHIIAAVLSIFPEWQKWNRESFSDYFEIFLDVPMDVLEKRDTKNLYARAASGEMPNVVGVDIPFPRPGNPDMVMTHLDQDKGVAACVDAVLDRLPPMK